MLWIIFFLVGLFFLVCNLTLIIALKNAPCIDFDCDEEDIER